MKFLNGWIDIPDEDLEKDTDEEVRVCQYCQADPSECGEWEECCYKRDTKDGSIKMKKEQLTTAYNIAIKYGFCGDCRWVHDSDECHKYDCYVNAVSVIQAAIRKAYRGNISD